MSQPQTVHTTASPQLMLLPLTGAAQAFEATFRAEAAHPQSVFSIGVASQSALDSGAALKMEPALNGVFEGTYAQASGEGSDESYYIVLRAPSPVPVQVTYATSPLPPGSALGMQSGRGGGNGYMYALGAAALVGAAVVANFPRGARVDPVAAQKAMEASLLAGLRDLR
jgi:hypothetical protein